MKNKKFNIELYSQFNYKSHITISILPTFEFNFSNYYKQYDYSIFISWLWFGIGFEYVYYKNN